jgi:hypothetical protein
MEGEGNGQTCRIYRYIWLGLEGASLTVISAKLIDILSLTLSTFLAEKKLVIRIMLIYDRG